MNPLERKFLLAVERGELDTLKNLLEQPNSNLDINCCDPLARNALIIGIDNENLPIVKLLVKSGIRIDDALLYAIDENFVEAVEILLDHEEAIYKQGDLHSWEQEREDSPYSADMTPLIMAAHRNNYEIIKILLDRRISPIAEPHDPSCHCNDCCVSRQQDCLKHSRSRLNAYKALASPCLIALSSPDPLLTAFNLSSKLESLARIEPEYQQIYLKLRAQCQSFATKLLDHTRTSKELEILLNYSDDQLEQQNPSMCSQICKDSGFYEMVMRLPCQTNTNVYEEPYEHDVKIDDKKTAEKPDKIVRSSFHNFTNFNNAPRASKKDSMMSLDSVTGRYESYKSHMRLARLRYAIHCKQKTFCAHPNIQELLAAMWYQNLPGFRNKNLLAQSSQVIFIGLMFPIYSIAYLVAPHSQLGRFIKKPFIKFICHSASYITFLTCLILASQRVEAFYSWDGVLRVFGAQDASHLPFFRMEANLTMVNHGLRSSDIDDRDLYNYYRQIGNSPPSSTARSFDSLTQLFEILPVSSKKRGTLPSPIELVILLWVMALLWAEVKQVKALGMNYYRADMWNTLDSVASGFYIGTIILRIISYVQSDEQSSEVAREHWHAYDPILLSEGLFAAATIFSALKLVYIFSINPYLGPLQISLGRMIIDIFAFSWIYMLVLFSFACGMNQLLWYYADLERHQCLNITNYNLANFYAASGNHHESHAGATVNLMIANGPALANGLAPHQPEVFVINTTNPTTTTQKPPNPRSNLTDDKLMEAAFEASLEDDSSKPPVTLDPSCKTWRYFANVFESSQTLFWATFGLVDLENFDLTGIQQYTRFWALLMFGCYCFINVIVVLNLLIAMMNHSYVKISKKSDIEWKFARTRLWMSYFDTGSTVPAPFNIVPSLKSLKNLARFILRRPKKTHHLGADSTDESQMNTNLTTSYQTVTRALVRRYLVCEQRLLERKRGLTEAKLTRWAKLNAFD